MKCSNSEFYSCLRRIDTIISANQMVAPDIDSSALIVFNMPVYNLMLSDDYLCWVMLHNQKINNNFKEFC